MSQDWNFGPDRTTVRPLDEDKPTPRKLRKILRREERHRAALPPPDADGASGRDAQGRFTQGNKGGTGNPFARRTAALRKALVAAVTEDDMAEIAATLVAKAKAGDVAAAKLLFSYVLGKPTEAANPDRLDLDDWQLLRERLSPLQDDWDLVKTMVPVEGLVEAGHKIADVRGANYRAEVLGPEQPPKPTPTGITGKTLDDLSAAEMRVLLREMSALVREEAEDGADATHGSERPAAPSGNGGDGGSPPSANGRHGLESVLPGHTGKAEEDLIYARQARMLPSRNGPYGAPAPSANGSDGRHPPSANGCDRGPPPSANGPNGQR